jgi:hypothetical protein
MKKIFAILISLLFVASVFGVAPTMAGGITKAVPDSVAVGELITVYYDSTGSSDPTVEGTAKVVKISGPTLTNETIEGTHFETKWVYKAYTPGTVKFTVNGSDTVSVTPKPHPMFSFMKILGLGKQD